MKKEDISQRIKNQEAEYEKIRKIMCKLPCVEVSPIVKDPTGGHIVAFRHPEPLMDKFTQFTAKIRKLVKSIEYDSTNAHTTIIAEKKPLKDFKKNEEILHLLDNVCENIKVETLQAVRICFKEWLFTNTSVIVAGRSINGAFWEVAKSLIEGESGKKNGLELEMPKIAHITAARFLDNSDRVEELKEKMSEGPILGESKPTAVWIGHYECSENGLKLTPYKERNL